MLSACRQQPDGTPAFDEYVTGGHNGAADYTAYKLRMTQDGFETTLDPPIPGDDVPFVSRRFTYNDRGVRCNIKTYRVGGEERTETYTAQ